MALFSPITAPAAVAQLQRLTSGLFFLSESDAPLQVVSYPKPAEAASNAELLGMLQEPPDEPVQVVELNDFLRQYTATANVLGNVESAERYRALQFFLAQHLAAVHVYRVGREPQIRAYALGTTTDGQLAGFKTVLTET